MTVTTQQPLEGNRSLLDLPDRVRSKVQVNPETGCWEWTGSRMKKGYGRLGVGSRTDGTRRTVSTHRYVWEWFNGPIPDLPSADYRGACVLHRCDNPACVNPEHLFLGSHRANMADRDAKGRLRVLKGAARSTAKLTDRRVRQMFELHEQGWSKQAMADYFEIDRATVYRILDRKRWAHVDLEVTL